MPEDRPVDQRRVGIADDAERFNRGGARSLPRIVWPRLSMQNLALLLGDLERPIVPQQDHGILGILDKDLQHRSLGGLATVVQTGQRFADRALRRGVGLAREPAHQDF